MYGFLFVFYIGKNSIITATIPGVKISRGLGKIALIQFDKYISIYKIENGMLITEPIEMIPIDENEEVIMAEWCDGSYVEQWEKVFLDGDVILDDNY